MATQIHITAMVDSSAEIADDVTIGPYVVVEPDVVISRGCRIMTGAIIRRYTILGENNIVHPYAVLGGEPQDYKFDPEEKTYLRIGSNNIFREYVTISRATNPGGATVIGNGCYFMTQSHVGHDSIIGDRVVLTNNAAIAGHCEVGDGAVFSGNTLLHQFCWFGELSMIRGTKAVSQHVPPFVMVMGNNYIAGLNIVGLRRADYIDQTDIKQIKEAYRLLYRSSLSLEEALKEMDAHTEWKAPAARFREFVRRVLTAQPPYNRGLVTARESMRSEED